MRFSFLASSALLVATLTAALPAASADFESPEFPNIIHRTPHVVHEERRGIPQNWWKHSKLHSRAVLPMRIGLRQQNLHRAEEFLLSVSHPDSPDFGKHWTAKQVAETFAPHPDSVHVVMNWLSAAGISPTRVGVSQSMGWLTFDATVAEAERLLKTEYNVYEHMGGQKHVACHSYSVPEHVQEHVDFITPTVHFDAKLGPRGPNNYRHRNFRRDTDGISAEGSRVQPGTGARVGQPANGFLPKKGSSNLHIPDASDISNCSSAITPACLRALYKFPAGKTANPKNAYGIVEYTPQAYLQTDLNMFFKNFSKQLVGHGPQLESIDGGVAQTLNMSFNFNGESNLDLEYGMDIVFPQKVILYQVGDLIEGASFNTFLDALDGSFCKFESGDDITQDPPYPDEFNSTFAFKGPQACGGFAATNVISTSYGYNEADLTPFYEQRQCAEYMKLGLQGITILYSSGDSGVAGNGGQCLDPATGMFNNGSSGVFNPSFPGGCPFITSVGATQVNPNTSVFAPESAAGKVIFSGGGFSNVFSLPSYQESAVHSWFKEHPPPYGADRFNNSMKARGFPDVAANGVNYVIAVDGNFSLVFGTSCSSPVFGGLVTLINEERLNSGKGPVGFLNPTLYAHPEVLTDIKSGNNPGCGTTGFEAVEGWDPVTGLGTPDFPKMLDLFLRLP